jgi:septal ring factor EnvC (AmiA/AmiB activator)
MWAIISSVLGWLGSYFTRDSTPILAHYKQFGDAVMGRMEKQEQRIDLLEVKLDDCEKKHDACEEKHDTLQRDFEELKRAHELLMHKTTQLNNAAERNSQEIETIKQQVTNGK